MKLTTNHKGEFILEEVYNPIGLVNGNEVIHLSMRDGHLNYLIKEIHTLSKMVK